MTNPQGNPQSTPPGSQTIKKTPDIPIWELQLLPWGTAEESRQSLDTLYRRVIEKAEDSIRWYLKKARVKRIGARITRLGAITMVTLTGLLPLLSQLTKDGLGSLIIAPGWASITVVLAAALIGLDKFFGCSSGWVRFISAGLKLQKILNDFQIDWLIGMAGWKLKEAPAPDEIQSMLGRAKVLLNQVDDIVIDETNTWIAEFMSALKMMEETAKTQADAVATQAEAAKAQAEAAIAKAEANKPCGLNIAVPNGGDSKQGWFLSIDNGQETKWTGTSAAAGNLAPGIHTVKVHGKIAGVTKQATKAVMVVSNSVEGVELSLA